MTRITHQTQTPSSHIYVFPCCHRCSTPLSKIACQGLTLSSSACTRSCVSCVEPFRFLIIFLSPTGPASDMIVILFSFCVSLCDITDFWTSRKIWVQEVLWGNFLLLEQSYILAFDCSSEKSWNVVTHHHKAVHQQARNSPGEGASCIP
jgi:hypothetical protein